MSIEYHTNSLDYSLRLSEFEGQVVTKGFIMVLGLSVEKMQPHNQRLPVAAWL